MTTETRDITGSETTRHDTGSTGTASSAIRRKAMDLLARREHASRELSQKLLKRFPDDADQVEVEIRRLSEEGLQSDHRLAESFVRARTSRGQGPVKIRVELRNKGVCDAEIELALEAAGVDWFKLARDVATRKFGEVDAITDRKAIARVSRFLQQRGFTFDQISQLY